MSTSKTTAKASATTPEKPHVVEDFNGMIKLLSDGTVLRHPSLINPNPQLDDDKHKVVSHFDFVYDTNHNLQLRVYRHELRLYKPYTDRPPIITLYVHGGCGGGFCLGSRTMAPAHNFCLALCHELADYVVSVDYRLAPESRIPAAVDDVWNALKWVRTKFCEGKNEKEFGRVVIFGDSAGGNIAHNLAVRIACGGWRNLEPVTVMGYVLLEPMFGGRQRTRSELEGSTDTLFNLDAIDRYWRLALPVRQTVDHPFVNPFGPKSPTFDQSLSFSTAPIYKPKGRRPKRKQQDGCEAENEEEEGRGLGPMLVMVGGKDILRDRVHDYVYRLSQLGNKVEYVEFEGLEHNFLAASSNPEPASRVLSFTKQFIKKYAYLS